MQITIPDAEEIQAQAVVAGFASVEAYINDLIDRDAERLAIQAGINDMRAGKVRPFEEFDEEFRKQYGLAPKQ